MDIHAMRAGLLKITLGVLLGSSWIFSSFLFASRPEDEAANSALTKLVRLPASIPKDVFKPQTRTLEIVQMETLRRPCWDRGADADGSVETTGARWVRLTGKNCENKAQEITVRNLSNGYVATVFTANLDQELTTDFIPLESGKNDIQIRFQQEPGTVFENKFTIQRQ